MSAHFIHPAYGQLFHELRTQHHLTSGDFEAAGVSRSKISRFENGSGTLGIEEFDAALQLMGVTLNEFENQLHELTRDADEQLFADVVPAYYARNAVKLRQLGASTDNRIYKLAVKSLELEVAEKPGLSADEQDEIVGYLLDIDHWGILELNVLNCVVLTLGEQLMVSLLADFWKHAELYYNIFKYRRKICQISLKAAMNFATLDLEEHAKLVLARTKPRLMEDDLFSKNIYLFVKSFVTYRFDDPSVGEAGVRRAMQIFDDLNCKNMSGFTDWLWERFK